MGVKVKITLSKAALAKLEEAQKQAHEMAVEAIRSDVVGSQVVPKETGELERSRFVDPTGISWGMVRLIFDTPYARRLYWHPEYRFRTDKNPNAQGKWLQTYIDGEKKNYAAEKFKEFLKQLAGRLIK